MYVCEVEMSQRQFRCSCYWVSKTSVNSVNAFHVDGVSQLRHRRIF